MSSSLISGYSLEWSSLSSLSSFWFLLSIFQKTLLSPFLQRNPKRVPIPFMDMWRCLGKLSILVSGSLYSYYIFSNKDKNQKNVKKKRLITVDLSHVSFLFQIQTEIGLVPKKIRSKSWAGTPVSYRMLIRNSKCRWYC